MVKMDCTLDRWVGESLGNEYGRSTHSDALDSEAHLKPPKTFRSSSPLSIDQAVLYARAAISEMVPGTCFTCRELFAGMSVRFNRRNLAQAILPLRGDKIIAYGTRKEPRENGNAGLATVWKVV